MASSSSSAPDLTVADEDVLECGVCFLPLKPPIFQCARGHVLCSPCSDKLRDAGKCHLCGVAMPGGYQRCHAMERVVDSVRTPCPRAPYGCEARPLYHALQDHVLASCAHAPCHCPAAAAAGEPAACGFKGSIPALLDHVGGAHGWPCTTARYGAPSCSVHLRDGFNFFVSHSHNVDEHGRRYLYLFNVVRHGFCRAASVIRVCPRVPAVKRVKLVLSFSYPKKREGMNETLVNDQFFHEQRIEFRVACSDLSDGLPDSYQLIVSKYLLRDDDDDMVVVVKQIFSSV
ncbi:hypothetical protein BDA96_09G050700 [Sorghum bicolor]|uniref:RING-type E3 ubiquitin transferase n=3 Tax=Sorghum bicolor TaxID=4558 RepID=A0A1Z5R0W5_SORBI|nr:hypothetical protein BDA96_09G050700 [Sorghum bicolor]OQU77422.1 hypothetical protein SORBI_3009G047500 [Sorghum bicolor]OQU77423.1 hypothetical protein SORBI_3009G047500 [Sorghum bicolor]